MQTIKQPVPNLQKNEKVILFIRRHWIAFLTTIIISLVMLLIPIGILLSMWFLAPEILSDWYLPIVAFISIHLFSLMIFITVSWIDWYFDILIVTDRRILDIHQNRLFNRQVDELELLHIEDSSSHLKGVLGTFFNVGDVYIQTAGTARNFLIENLPKPIEIARKIMELYHQRLHIEGREAQNIIDQHEGLGTRLAPAKDVAGNANMPIKETSQKVVELKESEEVKIPTSPSKNMSLVKFHVHRERLDNCLEILPSLKSPTINQLADKNYVAVETVIDEQKIGSIISELKQRGAENIIESKIKVL